MTRIVFKIILLSIIFLPGLVLLSCRSTSRFLAHPDAAETNRRSPDVFNVCLQTTKGKISIEVHRDWSPHGADRFYNLVLAGYYDDTCFFRVIQGRWAQFGINGDPKISNAWRARTMPDDPKVKSNTRGTIAYAFSVPNGRTTQLFINLKDNSATHDAEFVPFGKIVNGMEVADALDAEYGESAGGGIRGGKQGALFEKGNSFLRKNFPRLDYILRATVVDQTNREDLSRPGSRLQFGGESVELTISEASERTLRIHLSPLEQQAHWPNDSAKEALVPFPQTEKLRVRELSRDQRLRVGQLLVTIKPQPLTVNVRRADAIPSKDSRLFRACLS